MFAGIDVASERHWLSRLDDAGKPIGRPVPITEDRDGHDRLVQALGPAPVLVAVEATGHYPNNPFATLAAAGHVVAVLNPLVARRFRTPAWSAQRPTPSTRNGWRASPLKSAPPRAGFAIALLVHKVPAIVARRAERVHAPAPPVSRFHLAVHIRSSFDSLQIAPDFYA